MEEGKDPEVLCVADLQNIHIYKNKNGKIKIVDCKNVCQYTMVSHVGGSLGQLQILNLDQTVATHFLISIFKKIKAISPTDHFKAHLQCVHF